MRSDRIFAPVFIVNAVAGVPGYFLCFLFAYGFQETRLGNHVVFLVLITIFAAACGLVAVPLTRSSQLSVAGRARTGVLTSLALNSVVVGVGSIISALHKDEGSVSADFSPATDVLVATSLFAVGAVLATAAFRADVDH